MFIDNALNEYGTPISKHICGTCGEEFTVCPPTTEKRWGVGCLAKGCGSYDVKRDVDRFFDDHNVKVEREKIARPLAS